MHVNLRQLRAFDAVARLGSFAEAARALHVTPSALSIVIRDLEAVLGFRLLERTTRSVRLSGAGAQYLVHVQRVLQELRNAERCAFEIQGGRSESVVRIATTPAVISTLLPAAISRFRSLRPDVRLSPIDVPGNQIAAALQDGLADVAIGVQPPTDERFESQTLFSSRWHAFFRAQGESAAGHALHWADVASQPLIVINHTSKLRMQAGLPQTVQLRDVHEASSASAALAMAASGQGMAIGPGYLVPLAALHQLQAAPLVAPALWHELIISVARHLPADSAVRQWRDLLLAELPAVADQWR